MNDDLASYLEEARRRRGDPEYQSSLNKDVAAEGQSNARNALAAALMKSSSQFGMIGGKTPDASAPAGLAESLAGSNRQFFGGLRAEDAGREGKLEKMYAQLAAKKGGDKQEYVDEKGNRRVGLWQNGKLIKGADDPVVDLAKKEKVETGSWSPSGQVDEQGNMLLVNSKTGAFKTGPKVGDKGGGKIVASDVAQKVGQYDAAMKQAEALAEEWKTKTGTFSGMAQFVPGTDAAKYRDAQKLSAQSIGQIIEGGKLTESDYERYMDMMPTAGDSEKRAKEKLDRLKQYIAERKKTSIEGAGQAGYNIGGFKESPVSATDLSRGGAMPTATAAAPYKAGDRRTVRGKTFERDASGNWNEVK